MIKIKHPNTDRHRAGCMSCQMAYDKELPDGRTWPGLKDKSPAVRAITRYVKEAREWPEPLNFNYVSEKDYKTLAEAQAYADGVRFVNNSALKVVGIRNAQKRHGIGVRYEVLVWEEDAGHKKTYRVKHKDLVVVFP